MTLTESNKEPPSGYSSIGLFKTKEEALDWHSKAVNAGKKYPFWLNSSDTLIGKRWILWWMKPKNAKKTGKGFK